MSAHPMQAAGHHLHGLFGLSLFVAQLWSIATTLVLGFVVSFCYTWVASVCTVQTAAAVFCASAGACSQAAIKFCYIHASVGVL